MFPSSVIRKLALSEEMLAETHNFVGLAAHLEGPIDVDALTDAFDLLLEAHPVLTARLERGADGRHELVADDLMHAGLEVIEVDASHTDNPAPSTVLSTSNRPSVFLTAAVVWVWVMVQVRGVLVVWYSAVLVPAGMQPAL